MFKSMTKTVISSIAFFALGSSISLADPIAERQANMKIVGQSIGVVAKMAKGQSAFDGDAALVAFVAMQDAAKGFATLFPDGTETGGETEAAPAIFSDRAGFEAKSAEFEATLEMVVAAGAPADLDALRASLGKVGANCQACHKSYRAKK